MHVRTTVVVALILGVQLIAAGPAPADDGPVLVADTGTVALTAKESGEATGSITLQNQGSTDATVTVATKANVPSGCTITPVDATLKEHRQQKLTLTFAAACNREQGIDFIVTVGGVPFELHADKPKMPNPNWWAVVLSYLLVGLASIVVLTAAWNHWEPPRNRGDKDYDLTLPGLEASWKFTDSWAANATVLAALFTGIFGTKEVTTALLGEDASNLLAIALVAAAVSVGLAGLSPMVLQGFRRQAEKVDEQKDEHGTTTAPEIPAGLYVTPRALTFAAFFTLTATAGQLAALLYAMGANDYWPDWASWVVGGLGGYVLGWYAVKATLQNLTTGATLPAPKPATEKQRIVAHRLPAGLVPQGERGAELFTIAVPVPSTPPEQPRRRSAIL